MAQNPTFRALGLPKFRLCLPSRNWTIFLTVSASFGAAVSYDKWATRRVQAKWRDRVSHIALEPLDSSILPRKIGVYIEAPPGDGLRAAREFFLDYVKPVLTAGALEWEAVEGRKEGDVRWKLADRIRIQRRRDEKGPDAVESDENAVQFVRAKNGTKTYPGPAGDLVIGRHTWKEYIRGLHEGWLGPLVAPPSETTKSESEGSAPRSETQQEGNETTQESEDKRLKAGRKPSSISPEDYSAASPPQDIPDPFNPVAIVPYPHLLGIRNTPFRIYRFLTRRYLADEIGGIVAAAVLASRQRPFREGEIEQVLEKEEWDWWKTAYQPRKEGEEKVWVEDVIVDERIGRRMRTWESAD
ncbi:hypothetical protein K470DRAFT_218398 [Piedraia hortae CBS 480.64]|uniref:Mitochondrial import inner membrane translocase subunit TIM54 n=1 Tax=Piedraia hortae CBS 480.64 TaxID=1314780 RepID=A0A6A7BYR3_9PEZI|nr:hypothetical protein K470DRAFT_218398 [Piedraia hortae CBS 480.64]